MCECESVCVCESESVRVCVSVCVLHLTEMENDPGELWEPRMRKDPIG